MIDKFTLYAGCSFTAGTGFDDEKQSPHLWVNILHNNVEKLAATKKLNVSIGGRSNAGIFQDAIYNIVTKKVKYAFVTWTSTPRFEFDLGTELYSSRCCMIPAARHRDYDLNDINYTASYLEKIQDRFVSLPAWHTEIVKLVYYINTLIRVGEKFNTKIYFINGLCEWDNQYFCKLPNVTPDQYTDYTKKIINVHNRSDSEIYNLYNKIHGEYQLAGGIREQYWVNLYRSFLGMRRDVNNDGAHPGIESNLDYYKLISSFLTD